MKQTWIKVLAGKLAAVAALLLFLALVPAAAAGTLPLWAVLLLPPAQEAQPVARAAQPARTVPLRVVRGGRAA